MEIYFTNLDKRDHKAMVQGAYVIKFQQLIDQKDVPSTDVPELNVKSFKLAKVWENVHLGTYHDALKDMKQRQLSEPVPFLIHFVPSEPERQDAEVVEQNGPQHSASNDHDDE